MRTDLLERDMGELPISNGPISNGKVTVDLKAHSIAVLRLEP